MLQAVDLGAPIPTLFVLVLHHVSIFSQIYTSDISRLNKLKFKKFWNIYKKLS